MPFGVFAGGKDVTEMWILAGLGGTVMFSWGERLVPSVPSSPCKHCVHDSEEKAAWRHRCGGGCVFSRPVVSV